MESIPIKMRRSFVLRIFFYRNGHMVFWRCLKVSRPSSTHFGAWSQFLEKTPPRGRPFLLRPFPWFEEFNIHGFGPVDSPTAGRTEIGAPFGLEAGIQQFWHLMC